MTVACTFTNPEKPITLYYQGSFDPPHEGHRAALAAALKKTKAVAAVIVVDNSENLSKPNRSSWEHRLEMSKKTFVDFKNVTISLSGKDETKRELLKTVHLIALIGSDNFSLYRDRKSLVFEGICINLRYGETEDLYPSNLAGKPIFCSLPPIQNVSSSMIRDSLKTNFDLYTKTITNTDARSLNITLETLNYIAHYCLYNEYGLALKQITSLFSQSSLSSTYLFKPISPPCRNAKKLGGQSGCLFFKALNSTQSLFIKYFPKATHAIDYHLEINGWTFTKSIDLKNSCIQSPALHFTCKDFSFTSYPLLVEKDLAKSFLDITTKQDSLLFEESCFLVGSALSELHLRNPQEKENTFFKTRLDCLLNRTTQRLEKMDEDLRVWLANLFFDSWDNFLINPGPCSFVHFDATPSNFIISSEKKLIMLDLSNIGKYTLEHGLPLGSPAEDFYRFLGVLEWLNEDNIVTKSCMESFKSAFKKGYEKANHLITLQAHNLFSNYWAIRNYKCLKYYS